MLSNNFSKAARLPLLTLLACLPLLPQSSGYLTLGTPQKVSGKRGAAVETKIPVTVRPGFHVNSNTPSDKLLAMTASSTMTAYGTDNPVLNLSNSTVSSIGGSQPHTNFQPYLCVDFIISMFGVFPSQT